MAFANKEASKVRILGGMLNVPAADLIENMGDECSQKYVYTIAIPSEGKLAEKGTTKKEFFKAVIDEFSFRCDCEHDCCGCLSQDAYAHEIDGNMELTVFAKVNY